MTTKTFKKLKLPILFSLVVISTAIPLFMEQVDATSGHTCDNPHCYAIVHAKWEVWPFSGLREEHGLKGQNTIPTTLPSTSGTNHWTANPFWVIFPDNDWVEVGWLKGNGICGDHSTAEHYQLRVEDGIPTHYCLSASSGTDNYELSDTNTDKQWNLIVNGNTRTSDQDYDKGLLDAGGEFSVNTISLDGKTEALKYYDTQWRDWDHASFDETGQYSIDWCTEPTSFEYGDNPSC